MMTICLECLTEFAPSNRGRVPQRFCCREHARKFNSRRESRGAIAYDLLRVMRRERDVAAKLNIWTELCRVELSWNDEDAGRKTWKPAEMALADIAALDRPPTTNLYVKEKP